MFTTDQIFEIEVVSKTAAAFGIAGVIGSLTITRLRPSEFNSPLGLLFKALPYADLIDSIFKVIGRITPYTGGESSWQCQLQGFAVLTGDLASVVFSTYLGIMILIVITRASAIQQVSNKYVKIAVALGYLLPLPLSLFGLLNPAAGGDLVYRDGPVYCFITAFDYQLGLFYIPLFVAFAFNLSALIFTSIKVRALSSTFSNLTNSSQGPTSNTGTKTPTEKEVVSKKKLNFVVTRLGAFLTAFSLTWIFACVNFIATRQYGAPIYALNVLHRAFSGARGLWNMLAFTYCVYYAPTLKKGGSTGSNDKEKDKSGKHVSGVSKKAFKSNNGVEGSNTGRSKVTGAKEISENLDV